MKILSGNLKDKDINFNCKCCNANFILESKDDFCIRWKYKPIHRDGIYDSNIKIPEYSIKCPVCGHEIYIGLDPMDCEEDFNKVFIRNLYADIIFNRKDWKERYKTEVKVMNIITEYKVLYYDDTDSWIDTTVFKVNSIHELEDKARKYAEVLVKEGWEVAGWNYFINKK